MIDLSNTKLSQALSTLPQKVDAIDPFVQKIRVGQYKPHVIRLVLDLKTNVVPRTSVVEPKENFAHRLILDIHHPDKAGKVELNARADAAANTDFEADVLDELVATLVQSGAKQKTEPAKLIWPHAPKPQLSSASQVKETNNSSATSSKRPGKAPQKSLAPRILIIAIVPLS